MKRNLLHYVFPEGLSSIYINGKKYNKQDFVEAQKREKSRDSKGRFARKISFIN